MHFLFHEGELEDDCDGSHRDQWLDSWHLPQWGNWDEGWPCQWWVWHAWCPRPRCSHHWRWRGSPTSPWWGCEEQMTEEQLMPLLLYQWVLRKALDIPEAVTDRCHRWDCWHWPPWCSPLRHLRWSGWFEADDHWILDLGQRQRLMTQLMKMKVVRNRVDCEVVADEEVWDLEILWADLWAWLRQNDPQAELRYCSLVSDDLNHWRTRFWLDSLNPPWRPCHWCRTDRSSLCLRGCCCWSSWWVDCESHSMLTSHWCWGKEHWQEVHEHFEVRVRSWCSTQSCLCWVIREIQDGGRSRVQLCLAIGQCMTWSISGHEGIYANWQCCWIAGGQPGLKQHCKQSLLRLCVSGHSYLHGQAQFLWPNKQLASSSL